MKGVKIDMIGNKYNMLTVLSLSHYAYPHIKMYNCKCDCGNTVVVRGQSIREGHTKSCGCLVAIRSKEINTTHGQSLGYTKSTEMLSWNAMKQRCYNPKTKHYSYYGGKGITVCDRWLGVGGFANFLEDMGKKPTPQHSLDRFPDKNGNYGPSNCRWATKLEQVNNRSVSVNILYKGELISQTELAKKLKVACPNFIAMKNKKGLEATILYYENRKSA